MNASAQHTTAYLLGLDLGVQSVGWALFQLDEQQAKPIRLIASGVRCFQTGVGTENDILQGKDESPGGERRQKRQQRRQLFRRQQRLRRIWRALQEAGLLPLGPRSPAARHEAMLRIDKALAKRYCQQGSPTEAHLLPYRLRALALDQPLDAQALGRALYHLGQRRGFKGKTISEEEEKQQGKVKQGIEQLAQEMADSKARTLGEYFAGLDPQETRIRQRWTSRAMYEEEFEAIWNAQKEHHPNLTEDHKKSIHRAIFFQRPLKSQRRFVGRCELEPPRRRVPLACLEYQEFRYLQRVNDLELYTPEAERQLSEEERRRLVEALETNREMTFARIRKLLNIPRVDEDTRTYRFNLEEGGEKKLVGNRTAAKLRSILKERWDNMSADERRSLVDEILSFQDQDALARRLERAWSFDRKTSRQVAETPFERGFGKYSRKAIRRLLPMLREGHRLNHAINEVYGPRSVGKVHDRLPPVHEALPELRNPLVSRALTEMRRVVNAIVAQYGKPALIRVELARDLKAARKERQTRWQRMRQNEKRRVEAKKKVLEEFPNIEPSRNDILKVLLAEECNWECPYTGRQIDLRSLVGGNPQFDIEHILPRSRSLDDSVANKTLCYHEENRHRKQGRTPWEAYGTDSQRWHEILQRVKRFKGPLARAKLERFQMHQIPEDFVNRQLSDTRYISKAATAYLAFLYGGRSDEHRQRIQTTKGQLTALVRAGLNLNRILGNSGDKTREDHRHHAIDAIVTALCDPGTLRAFTRQAQRCERTGTRFAPELELPWPAFLQEVRGQIGGMIVSHRCRRRLAGPLHKDGNYAIRRDIKPDGTVEEYAAYRKPLEAMSWHEVERIIDPTVRRLVQEKLEQFGAGGRSEPGKCFKDANNHPYRRDKQGRIIPIHAARIRVGDKPKQVGSGLRKRYAVSGSNSHVEVFAVVDANGDTKRWEWRLVSRLEAYARYRANRPIVDRNHAPDRRFLFSLRGTEMVEMEFDGARNIYLVEGISHKEVEFRLHNDARPITDRKKERVRCSPRRLMAAKARKVVVDPLGQVFPAND